MEVSFETSGSKMRGGTMNASHSNIAKTSQEGGPRKLDYDERRAQIIETACELYRERGLARTSIKDVAQRVGVSRTLFYHYFPDKDALTSAVMDAYTSEFLEALMHWNEERREGDIEHALSSVVKLLRVCLFENDPFHIALASQENAELYLMFENRVADHATKYILDTTVRDYEARHEIRIDHLYETFYILIMGVIGYLRQHPDADDSVIADVIAQTLHMDRS